VHVRSLCSTTRRRGFTLVELMIAIALALLLILGVNMVLMALFGGVRHLFGPVVGALIIAPAGEYFLTNHGETQLHIVLSGALLAVVVLFMPDGVIPALRSLVRRFDPAAASIREETQAELRDRVLPEQEVPA
jgi:branched-chain amino acid transport system permease protein